MRSCSAEASRPSDTDGAFGRTTSRSGRLVAWCDRPDRAGPRRGRHGRDARSGCQSTRCSIRLSAHLERRGPRPVARRRSRRDRRGGRPDPPSVREWMVATEVSFSVFGERGSIDILAFHAPTRLVLIVEVKSVVPDVQATLVTIDRKERLALGIARDRGWQGDRVARLLVIRDDRTARRRVDRHATTFANAFPDRGRLVRSWLRSPDPGGPLRGLWFLSDGSQPVAKQRVRCGSGGRTRDFSAKS